MTEPLYRELAMALSYGRSSALPVELVRALSVLEHEISVAPDDTAVINAVRGWASLATKGNLK